MTDLEYLRRLLADERLSDDEREAFESMYERASLGRVLSPKQVSWIRGVAARLELDADEMTGPAFASGAIPVGRPVETPAVLRHLPKTPPGRRST